ncbi:MAG: hypothetical protein MEQ84_04845 [Mesorhizobium sp.]|nr:hypothetical protein [Mesorhizobium sp.]
MSLDALLFLAPIVVVPLFLALLALVPAFRGRMLGLLPFAALPGLVSAIFAPVGTSLVAPDILFGLRLEITEEGALFLGAASALWIAAGIYARSYMSGTHNKAVFCAFWCLTLAGNLGVFVAGDAATFYLSFACVSLAAYPLVVHQRTERAMRAGLVYIVLALIGETCLLAGVLLSVAGADGIVLADMREALGASPDSLTIALLVAGFGIKAGLVPLHVWLPLAHPAAPTPASAVLSGAIVKAGIFGLIQFLPLGSDAGSWGTVLVLGGIFGCWYGIVVGLTQFNPKTLLAYSTVSQMGIVVAVIGSGLSNGAGGAAAAAAATLYAWHHGFAKGALFLGVGVAHKSGRGSLGFVTVALALVSLSVAGLPLLGGALAKLAIKGPLGGGLPELLVTLSAVGTSLLMLRFLFLVQTLRHKDATSRPPLLMFLPFAAMGVCALIGPWFLFAAWSGESLGYAYDLENLWTALWPMLVAVTIGTLFLGFRPRRATAIPEGDLLVPVEALVARMVGALRRLSDRPRQRPEIRRPMLAAIALWLGRVEAWLANWAVAGTLMILLLVAIAALGLLFD